MEEKNYYSVPAVSSSSLKWFENSPLYFRMKLDKEIEDLNQSFFEFGKKVHMKLLEPNEFEKNYITLDYDLPKSDQQRKFCEDYVAQQGRSVLPKAVYAYQNNYSVSKDTREVVEQKALDLKEKLHSYIMYLTKRTEVKDVINGFEYNNILESERKVKEHKKAFALLYTSDEDKLNKDIFEKNEFEIYWKHPLYNIDCKSAIDRLMINHTDKIITLVDIKTTAKLSKFSDSVDEYNYYRQFTFYWLAIHWYFKNVLNLDIEQYTKETYVIAIQKNLPKAFSPIECKVFEITDTILSRGLDELDNILPKIAWHFENNLWDYSREYYEGNGIEKL